MQLQSNNILSNIPQHIVANYPLFVDFLQSYFEFMDQTGNPSDIIGNFNQYMDIDSTIDDFLEYFKNNLLKDIPKSVMCDERLLLKHIKELYTSKGSEASYKFLFRALYNKEISFNIPNDSVLRPSDGKWKQDYSITAKISKDISFDTIKTSINKKISLTNINGRKVYATIADVKNMKIDGDHYDDGYYYVEIFLINNLNTINEIKTLVQ